MKKLAELAGREAKWEQPGTLKMEYELRANDELAATLHFKSSFGSFATAVSADGSWTFKRVGFWQTWYEFKTEAGETMFSYHNIGGVLHASSLVKIQPRAAEIAELPWMVMLGWYLILMMQQDAAVAAM